MTSFRFAVEADGGRAGFRRAMPDQSLLALAELLDAVRRLDVAAGNTRGSLFPKGAGEHSIESAVRLLWGDDVWNSIQPSAEVEPSQRRKADSSPVIVEDPNVCTMSAGDRRAIRDTAEILSVLEGHKRQEDAKQRAEDRQIADWAVGRAAKPAT